MNLAEYTVLFALVAIMGAGLPGPGDAALIAAGTLAGEGRASLGIVLATAMGAWMLGSLIGFEIGVRKGRWLLEHPGRLEKARRKMLAKGDSAFSRNYFVASVTMPAFVSGIFRVRFYVFALGAVVAGIGWIGVYVGLSYFLGAEIAQRDRTRRYQGNSRCARDRRRRAGYQGRAVEMARFPAGSRSRQGAISVSEKQVG